MRCNACHRVGGVCDACAAENAKAELREARRLIQELLDTSILVTGKAATRAYWEARAKAQEFLDRYKREPWTAEKEREAERLFDESCGTRR